MREQEINIDIAEACGLLGPWTEQVTPCGCDGQWDLFNPEGVRLPNYCRDLNAMHEAEELLELSAKFGAHDYAASLYHICVPRDVQHGDHFICWVVAFYLLNATARQRAEAFLRTIGKWEESK